MSSSSFEIATIPSEIHTAKGGVIEKLAVAGVPSVIIVEGKAYKLSLYNGELSYDFWKVSVKGGKNVDDGVK